MLGNLIMGFIVILVGTSLAPTVADQVVAAQAGNVTGASSTILGLTTLFYVLGVASAGISVAAQGLRASGLV
jgi:xanthine/uracil permease